MHPYIKIELVNLFYESSQIIKNKGTKRWRTFQKEKNERSKVVILVSNKHSILSVFPELFFSTLCIKQSDHQICENHKGCVHLIKKDDHLSYDNEKEHLFLVGRTEVLPACCSEAATLLGSSFSTKQMPCSSSSSPMTTGTCTPRRFLARALQALRLDLRQECEVERH